MKRKLSIVLAITLTLILSLSTVAFAAGGEVAEKEVDLAQDAGQAWLDRIAATFPEPAEWKGAHLAAPQVYYNLKGESNAYMFAMENDGVVGHIIVGSSAYGYPVFEAGEAAPPSIPTADEVKSSIERDLGLKIAKESIGEPSCLLYLGIDKLYAIYEVEGQTIGVNLISERATLASNLKSYMPSPEEYKAAKKEAKGSKPLSLRSSGYNCLEEMEYYREGDRKWCGPCSGVSIGWYYRTEHEPNYDDLPSPNSYMYDWLRFEMGVPTLPAAYGPAFIAMAEGCPGHYDNFSYVNNYHLEDSDYWTVVDDIDSSWPLGLEITDEWHWVAIKGYSYNTDTDRYEVICTDSAACSNWRRIDWLLLGWWDFTCCIKD